MNILVDNYNIGYLHNDNWRLDSKGYVIRESSHGNIIYLHRQILAKKLGRELLDNEHVDHKNLNKLDNREENLRLANHSQNGANAHKRDFCASIYKGVNPTRSGTFSAEITKDRIKYRKNFKTEIEVAQWYDKQALKLHGEFARLNFPRTNYI